MLKQKSKSTRTSEARSSRHFYQGLLRHDSPAGSSRGLHDPQLPSPTSGNTASRDSPIPAYPRQYITTLSDRLSSESGNEIPISHLQDSDQDAIYQEVEDVDDIYDDVDQSQMMMQHLDTRQNQHMVEENESVL